MIHITERTVTIKLGIEDQIGNRLVEIRKQRDALLNNSKIKIGVDSGGFEQARRASVTASAAHASAMKDLSALGSSITSKAVAPLAQYSQMLGAVANAGRAIGPGLVSALGMVSAEFQRQKTLAAFWGTSGAMHLGVTSLKSSLSGFLSGSGSGFAGWLQSASANLVQYRTALTVAAAAMVGMAAAAALSSKHSQNYIKSTLDSRLMARKLPDKAGAEKWVESAQGEDWSAGRDSRMGTFQTVLSKNKGMGQQQAQKATEDIEKFFFANQEMLQKKGIASAEQLASEISAPQLTGDSAAKFEDIFGLGFSTLSSQARLGRLSTEAPDDKELAGAVNARPDEALSKRLTATTAAMGDAVLPALNSVLGGFIKLSDIIGKIPGLGKAMGWGAVLLGAASAGLVMVSMVGTLIPGLITVMGVMSKLGIVTKLMAAAQWVLNVAMSANPLGIAIIAIAGLVVVLYALEKKFGLVTKAWKMFSESSIGKGVFAAIADGKKAIEDLLGTLGKAYKSGGVGGVLKVALEGIVANSPLFKMVAFIFDVLRKLWNNSNILNKLINYGVVIWQKMVDFFTWLLDTIKGGLQWIKDGLGITKQEKQTALDKKTPAGWKWEQSGDSGPGWYKNAVKQQETPALKAAREARDKAPKGFFGGIPGISDLTKAIEDLIAQLSIKAIAAAAATPGNWAAATAQNTMVPGDQSFDTNKPISAATQTNAYDAAAGALGSMDVGGTIIGSGAIIGHRGEQVNPADVVLGGETTLEKINRMFSGAAGSGGGQTIHAPISLTVVIEKVEKAVDVDQIISRIGNEGADKLLFALRNKMENGSTRGIGYLRG